MKKFREPKVAKVFRTYGKSYACKVCGRKVKGGEFYLVDEFPICANCLSEVKRNPLGVLVAVIRHYELEIEELEFEKDLQEV